MHERVNKRRFTAAEDLLEHVPRGPHDLEVPVEPVDEPLQLVLLTSLAEERVVLGAGDRVGVKQVNEEFEWPEDVREDTGEHG